MAAVKQSIWGTADNSRRTRHAATKARVSEYGEARVVRGDFSRLTFRPAQHFAAVVMQQGRPMLDSDWNEQAAITMEAVRSVVRDLLGPHGGTGDGFRIEPREGAGQRSVPWDVLVRAGSYYVDGIRCENPTTLSFRQAAEESACDGEVPNDSRDYLAYLDVWERNVTSIENPELREIAMGSPETSSRLQVVWRVRLMAVEASRLSSPEELLAERFGRGESPGMGARVLSPAGYTGLENHLYRVEVHAGGRSAEATFKWSRDNGSVVAPVAAVEPDRLVIASTSSEEARFSDGMWVEPEDEGTARCGHVPRLIRIDSIAGDSLITSPPWPLERKTSSYRLIRRWDHGETGDASGDGAVPLVEGRWIDLEAGIQIAFAEGGDYRAGDYWLIPARTAVNDIEWPTQEGEPLSTPPGDVEHHHAPLAHLEVRPDGTVRVVKDLRRHHRPPWAEFKT